MIQDMLQFAREQVAQGRRVVLVTVTQTSGSSPASAGQMMAVLASGESVGTVGGGATEHRVKQLAAEALQKGERVFEFSFDHAENGMVCGGAMRGFGAVIGGENRLFIFGGGHVAQSLAPLALSTGFLVTVVEDRPEYEVAFPGCRYIVSEPARYEADVVLQGDPYVVICTRGHKSDGEALRFCLAKPTRYLGMIGSAAKVGALFDGLRRDGFTDEALRSIYTPIGLNVASAVPAEIAVSILAEILLVKNGGTPDHKRKPL